MTQNKFDLHMHSICSDGGEPPEAMIRAAKDAGIVLAALTDHDTVMGVPEALAAGKAEGVAVLPALEVDTEWPSELHILGLDVDTGNAALRRMLDAARERRIERNAVILERLNAAGIDVASHLHRAEGCITKLHIALALIEAGYADSVHDAFAKYLRRGCPGFYEIERPTPEAVIAVIREAGGVPTWAHPFHAGGNIPALMERLIEAGLRGVEAYHPSASAGQSEILVNLARQGGLLVTCGSDSHGSNRPENVLGSTWRDTPVLAETYAFFLDRLQNR